MALSVAALSGCSASFTDGGNMMRPPRPTGDKAEIQNIIEEKSRLRLYICISTIWRLSLSSNHAGFR